MHGRRAAARRAFVALLCSMLAACASFRGEQSLPFSVVGMVEVPAGSYHYDCNEEVFKDCDEDEIPGSTRSLPTFYIDRTEATVAEYRECVDAGVCTEEGLEMTYWQYAEQPQWAWACNWNHEDRKHFEMASTYCEWRGKRLPTQGEWQKAARGTDGWTYPWGNRFPKDRLVGNVADETYKKFEEKWKIAEGYDDGYLNTAPVGSFPDGASPYGAVDMAGNVWEWTSSHPVDEQGEEDTALRWVNGGGFDTRPSLLRVTYHYPTRPGSRFAATGLRCAH